MFNKNYRKRALAEAERMVTQYQGKYEETIGLTTDLHGKKETAVEILKAVDEYIHSLSNKPSELEKIMSEINIRRRVFEQEVHDLQIESKKADTLTGSPAGAGTAAGVGVAALGPTVAWASAVRSRRLQLNAQRGEKRTGRRYPYPLLRAFPRL